jgi:hypothetical protein
MRATAPALALLVASPALLLAACKAERTLRFTSDPPGAEVSLDGTPVGLTPVEVEFFHYGTRRVVFRRPGYGTTSLRVELQVPWYARFPLDIVSEVVLPFGWKDKRHLHVDLVAGSEEMSLPDLRSVFDRAEALRRAGPKGPQALPEVKPREVPPAQEEEDEEETPEPPERPDR